MSIIRDRCVLVVSEKHTTLFTITPTVFVYEHVVRYVSLHAINLICLNAFSVIFSCLLSRVSYGIVMS